jgi:diguanylate cyclase (GGDEF)-like protein/PAS domain S-box-containing protein
MKKNARRKSPAKITKAKPLKSKQPAMSLRRGPDKYRILVENSPDGYFILKGEKILLANKAFASMTGYPGKRLLGMDFKSLLPPEETAFLEKIRKMRARRDFDLHLLHRDGATRLFLRTSLRRIRYDGEAAVLGVARDISEQKRTIEALRQSEEKYRTLFEESRDAIAFTDRDGTIRDVNRATLDLFGYNKEQMTRMKFQHLYMDPADVERFQREIEKKGSLRDHEVTLRKKGGESMHCLLIATQRRSEDGTIVGYQGIVRDMTAQKALEEALRESERRYKDLSITDDLTGLFNQRHFYNQLRAEIDRIQRYKHPLALLLIDVDNFKIYNDTYGHLAGDKVLARLGAVIRGSIRRTDSGYRYGGEEFTVILTETRGRDAGVAAERLRKSFADEIFFPVPLEPVRVTVSIGIADYHEGEEIASFVKRADQNMYEAKSKGKNCVYFSD